MSNQEACSIAGQDMANDFIKQMMKMKLTKEDELLVLTAVAKRINEYVKHETIRSLSKAEKSGSEIALAK